MNTAFEIQYFAEKGNNIIAKIKAIDSRISAHFEDGFIIGSFRGKQGTSYKFSVASHQFIYKGSAPQVSSVIEQVISLL